MKKPHKVAVDAAQRFHTDLYKAMETEGPNESLSTVCFGVGTIIAMAVKSAKGPTEEQMLQTIVEQSENVAKAILAPTPKGDSD